MTGPEMTRRPAGETGRRGGKETTQTPNPKFTGPTPKVNAHAPGITMAELLAEQDADHEQMVAGLVEAESLAKSDVPIFIAHAALDTNGNWLPTGGSGGCGYILPSNWQKTEPDPRALDFWQPGMAICAVMGHNVDAVDIDPRHDGDKTAKGWKTANMYPTSYGRQKTPSGGYHDLIYPLRVGSMDATGEGIDVKGGHPDGSGRGFIFLAPTRKAVKGDDGKVKLRENGKPVIGRYEWEVPPHLEDLDDNDDTGLTVASLIEDSRPGKSGGKAKTGGKSRSGKGRPCGSTAADTTEYDEMDEGDKRRVVSYIAAATRNMTAELEDATSWPEGYTDDHGRGWQKLVSDAAYRLGALARASWTNLSLDDGRAIFMGMVPAVIARDVPPEREWNAQCNRGDPAPFPAPGLEGDFRGLFGAGDGGVGSPVRDDGLFERSPEFATLEQFALSRRAAPGAVIQLAVEIAGLNTPYWVRLDTGVDEPASLNGLVAICGGSGGGKGRACRTAQAALGLSGAVAWAKGALGSAEGLADQLMEFVPPEDGKGKGKGKWEYLNPNHAIWYDEPEIGVFRGHKEHPGSMLDPMMRKTFMAESLMMGYRKANRIPVMDHEYRALVTFGVQTKNGDILLNPESITGGTPQRIMWVSGEYPHGSERPAAPPPLVLPSLDWEPPVGSLFYYMECDPEVIAEIDAWDVARSRGELGELDGHAGLVRAKTAAKVAILHGRQRVTWWDWETAGLLMARSDRVRDWVQGAVAANKRKERDGTARTLGRSAAVAKEAEEATFATQCAEKVREVFKEPGLELPYSRIVAALTPRLRDVLPGVLNAMVSEGVMVREARTVPRQGKKLFAFFRRATP